MEFDDLGKHCSYCQQKDILPMQCGCCNQYFCLEHIQRESHKCSMASINNNTVVVCKACDQTIRLVPGVSPKILIEEHVRFNCNPKQKKIQKYCGAQGCRAKLYSSNTITCSACGMEVCIKHRFPEDHKCSPKQVNRRFNFFNFWNKH